MSRKILFKLIQRSLLQPWHRFRRGMTLGTRTLVLNEERQILLIKHTYADGWMLPGGGVERGETLFESAMREVFEEASVTALETPVLVGFCNNDEHFRGDHIAILLLRKFSRTPFVPNQEIAAAEFFELGNLPPDTTSGTRRRIAEVTEGRPVAQRW